MSNSEKLLSAILALIIIGVSVSSCQRKADYNQPVSVDSPDDKEIRKYIDPETRCQYLVFTGGSITPRLAKDGKPVCYE